MGRSCGRTAPLRAPAACAALLLLALLGASAPERAWAQGWTGGGPEIGWVRDLLESSEGILFAATWGGGVFQSTDGGRSWTEATRNVRDAVVIALHESPEFPFYIYAATSDRAFLRRAQGSDFWAPLGGFPIGESPPGLSLETFPTRPNRVAYGSDFGVYVSNSYGGDWPDTLSYAAGQTVNDLLVVDALPNTIHAVTPFEILVTNDTGQSVQFYSEGLAPSTFLIDLEAWSSGADSMLVADQRGPLWQFVDRERFVEVGPVEPGGASNKYFSRIDPGDPDRILMGSSAGLWRSADRLQSWELVDGGLDVEGAEIWALDRSRVGVTDSLRLGSFTLGFVRTGPGGDLPWIRSNSGLTAAWARSIHPVAGSTLCGTAHGRLFRSVDGGASWDDVSGALRTLQIAVAHDTGSAWIVSGSTGVFRSIDQGASWDAIALPAAVRRLNRLVQLDDVLFAVTNAGLARSDDDGASFVTVAGVSADRAGFALASGPQGHLAVGLDALGPLPPRIAVGHPDSGFTEIELPVGFRGAVRGIGFAGDELLVGSDGFGGTPLYRLQGWNTPAAPDFVDLAGLVGDGSFDVRDLALRANVVVLGTTGDGVFLSEDRGATWREWNEELPTRRIESVAIAGSPSRAVWVATLGRGAFTRTLDEGVPLIASNLRARPDRDAVVVELHAHGGAPLRVWRRSTDLGDRLLFEGPATGEVSLRDVLGPDADRRARLAYVVEGRTGTGWVEATRIERTVGDVVAPPRSRLFAAAPNPFNPRTELRFELAEAGRVMVEVFDARGRRVRGLLDRELNAGPHTMSFDGRDDDGAALASGVYYLRVRTPDEVLNGRVTLLR